MNCPKCGKDMKMEEGEDDVLGIGILKFTCSECGHTVEYIEMTDEVRLAVAKIKVVLEKVDEIATDIWTVRSILKKYTGGE